MPPQSVQQPKPIVIEQRPEPVLSAAPARFLPETLDEVRRIATIFYDSGMMAAHFYDTKRIQDSEPRRASGIAGIGAMIMYGAELGLSPMQAMRMMHVIEGRAVLSAAGKVALVKRSPRCVYFRIVEASNTHCIAETVRREDDGKAGPPRRLTVRVGQAPAQSPPDTIWVQPGSSPAWSRYPARMLKARCASWLCDDEYEDITAGLYAAEEIIDMRDGRSNDQRLEAIFDMVDVSPQVPAGIEVAESSTKAPTEKGSRPGQTTAEADNAAVQLRASLAAATTPEQCIELYRLASEIRDDVERKAFRNEVLAKKEQMQ